MTEESSVPNPNDETDATSEPEWTWPDGALLIFTAYGHPRLVKVERATEIGRDRYGVHYIQSPALGRPSGGSGWTSKASDFRAPASPEEFHTLAVYRTAERVRTLRADLADAEKDAEATARYGLLLAVLSSTPEESL